MTRILLLLCCIPIVCWAQYPQSPRKIRKPEPPGILPDCPYPPATCQVNAPVFNFGRAQMSPNSPATNAQATISVTCTRAPRDGLDVEVHFELVPQPPDPARQMRNVRGGQVGTQFLRYELFVDPGRTRYWGDGTNGTLAYPGTLLLNDRNRVGTLAFPIFGRVDGGQLFITPDQWLGAVVAQVRYDPICH
jgi:spore coat protein U-like protein